MLCVNVTYEVVTPESAEIGDYADAGYAEQHIPLRDAIRAFGPFIYPSSSVIDYNTWYSSPPEIDYTDGSETTYSLHLQRSITTSSARRLARLLGAI